MGDDFNVWLLSVLVGALGALVVYVWRLEDCFSVPAIPATCIAEQPTDDELRAIDYSAINDCEGLPNVSNTNWVVVGGAGSVGAALADILVRHGAPAVRVLDIQEPPSIVLNCQTVEFIKTDIRDKIAVRAAFRKPFASNLPLSVHVTAAAIRFFERLAYVKHLSFDVNSQGVQNVVDAVAELPGEKRLIYTSSVSVMFRKRNVFWGQRRPNLILRDGQDLPEDKLQRGHYVASKRAGERAVLGGDRTNGLRTAVVRPGMAVLAPRDLFIATYLQSPVNLVWSGRLAQSAVCCKDVARAHIFGDAALRERPDEVAGQTFLITGDATGYRFDAYRYMTQFFAGRDLRFTLVPGSALLFPALLNEVFLYLRFHALRLLGIGAAHVPSWAKETKMIQPTLWTIGCADVIVEDERARKLLGYFSVWPNAHAVKWIVDEVEGAASINRRAPLPRALASGQQ